MEPITTQHAVVVTTEMVPCTIRTRISRKDTTSMLLSGTLTTSPGNYLLSFPQIFSFLSSLFFLYKIYIKYIFLKIICVGIWTM